MLIVKVSTDRGNTTEEYAHFLVALQDLTTQTVLAKELKSTGTVSLETAFGELITAVNFKNGEADPVKSPYL